jgi:hypothetical protein
MNPKRRTFLLALGVGGLVAWITIFAAGVLINSKPFREPLERGEGVFYNFIPAAILYTPVNAAILSVLAGLIGGCASNLTVEQDELNKLCESAERDNLRAYTLLRRRLMYLIESPFISALRGFVVYLTFMAGILIAADNPFKDGSGVIFMRYAGFVSLVAFIMGYDPTRFEELLQNVPTMGTPKKDAR